jgi:hypothetical protein
MAWFTGRLTAASAGACEDRIRTEPQRRRLTALSAAILRAGAGHGPLVKSARMGVGSTKVWPAARAIGYRQAQVLTDVGSGLEVPCASTFAKDPRGG